MPESNSQFPVSSSAWSPLRIPIFRNLLIADFVSDVGSFMQAVGAAWLMTSLSSSPLQIALIQTASALPFFILALPAGSIGDIVDRRKLILGTELWMLAVACILVATTLTHVITPWLLLLLTFALSIGDALESPAWRAIFPELVPKEQLPPALTLNGIEFNLARAVGPALGGLIIAVAGVSTAFLLNVFSFFGVIVVIARWKRHVPTSKLPVETFTGATSAAIRYVRYSPGIGRLLLRSAFVVFFSSAFWALLPAVAKNVSHSSLGYGLLLGFFGTGAVLGAVALQRLRKAYSVETVVAVATAVFACVLVATALVPRLWILCFFSFFGGAAWTIFMSVFNTLIQLLAPDWVRARVLAVYLFVFQGSMAIGSVLWGASAEHASLAKALLASGIGIAACLLLRLPFPLPEPSSALDVWNHWPKPAMFEVPEPDEGPVLITVEYKVAPDKSEEFLEAIYKYQRIRRRDGATRWGVYYDAEFPGQYLETFLVDSWAEHERQHYRFTVADRTTENEVARYALEPIRIRHFIYARKAPRS
ncbi:MAG TPA: MFS transporter [Candidatus Acidoferrales bacterium]|nr:MFS transporter [Candidatus Acidoferrales bacterium]